MSLLQVKNLNISFSTSKGDVQVIRDVSFNLEKGESLGFVGESGSGKSVTVLSILNLLASNAKVKSGEILFAGEDLLRISEKKLNKIRGSKISMIFQDPMTSLNPSFTVGFQIIESLKIHKGMNQLQAQEKAVHLLGSVGIHNPEERLKSYPHQFSGGMSQRVMIAMAISCEPDILIADEPTTALDVTVQKQILELINELKRKNGMSVILVSHDLGIVSQYSERVAVMYAGEMVEVGLSKEVIKLPFHPYTKGLIECLPGKHFNKGRNFRLPTISGLVPNLIHRPEGCQLYDRCQMRMDKCRNQKILLEEYNQRKIRCLLTQDTNQSIKGIL